MENDLKNAISANLKLWAEDLACPVCFGALKFSALAVLCAECGRQYPIIDDIPVLIPQRATCPSHK